jgi:hypothetical protein
LRAEIESTNRMNRIDRMNKRGPILLILPILFKSPGAARGY